jgi:hypothetical protein
MILIGTVTNNARQFVVVKLKRESAKSEEKKEKASKLRKERNGKLFPYG